MLLSKALDHFHTCAEIARALNGACEPSAVYQWQKKGVVPLWAAHKLSEVTEGKLEIDERLYDQKGRIQKPRRRVA